MIKLDEINSWTMAVCICCVIACLAEMLIPDPKYEKTVRFVLGSLMLCAMIEPLRSITADSVQISDSFDIEYEADTEQMRKTEKQYIEKKLADTVKDKLTEKNIELNSISVNVGYDEENVPVSVSCRAVLAEKDSRNIGTVRKEIAEILGDESIITVSAE